MNTTPTDTPTITPIPGDLAVTLSDSPDPVANAATLTYTIQIENIGEFPVGGVIDPATGEEILTGMINQEEPGFLLFGYTFDQGNCFVILMSVRCDFDAFEPGEIVTVEIWGIFKSAMAATIANTVFVDLPLNRVAEQIETLNNIATEFTAVLAPPTPMATITPTPTPTKQPDPGDTDGDGCSDQRENGPDETLGDRRDYKNPWDFYDVLGPGVVLPIDGVIDLPNDILGVVQHFAPTGAAPYDVQFDRGPQTGQNVWNISGPDGVIDLPNDIIGVILQFNHSCV